MTTMTGHLTDAQAQRLVDATLPPGEAAEVEAHAAGCPECGALIASYAALTDALADLDMPELPTGFTAGVLEEIDRRERAAARERRFAFALCAAGLAAIVALGAWLAGATSWAPALTGFADGLGAAGRAVRLVAEVVPPVVSAIRVPLALACAAAVTPLLYALSRLMLPSRRAELA